jgi:hypothetical protein
MPAAPGGLSDAHLDVVQVTVEEVGVVTTPPDPQLLTGPDRAQRPLLWHATPSTLIFCPPGAVKLHRAWSLPFFR